MNDDKAPEKGLALADLALFLAHYFATNQYANDERGGVFRPSDRPVYRLGLALEPSPGLPAWVCENHLDALWMHRPWKLDLSTLPPDVGILYHHLPFDESLTLGYSPVLAAVLPLTTPEPIGYKQAPDLPPRPIGMLGDVPDATFEEWCQWVLEQFGGHETIQAGRTVRINRMAVVGAMNETLLHEAAQRGATLYLTGQYRPSAKAAVLATGMAVIAVGHYRSEAWGLRALEQLLRETWPKLQLFS